MKISIIDPKGGGCVQPYRGRAPMGQGTFGGVASVWRTATAAGAASGWRMLGRLVTGVRAFGRRAGLGANPGRGPGRRLLLAAGLLGIGIAAGTSGLIAHLHTRALTASSTELQRLALVLSHQAERTIQAVELVQASILERLTGVATDEQYRQAMSGIEVHHDLQGRIRGLPQIDAVTAIDATGKLLNFTRYWPIPDVNIADRDYFKALSADRALQSFISVPVRNRGTSTWTVYVARKVAAPDGRFLGLILAALELEYFERLYADAGFGSQSSVSLFRDDGMLLARHPHYEPGIGRPFAIGERLVRMRATGLPGELARTISGLDGLEKLIAARLLPHYPLSVVVSMTVDQALSNWRKEAVYLLLAGLLLELVIIGIGLLVGRQMRGQGLLAAANLARVGAETELALARERALAQDAALLKDVRYGLALNTMSQGVNMFDADHRLVLVNPRYEAMFGIPSGSLSVGMRFDDVIDQAVGRGLSSREVATEAKARLMAHVAAGKQVSDVRELEDGRSLSACIVPMAGGGWLATYEDITERRKAEAQITHMAHHDALTGLPNRLLYRRRLEDAIRRSRRDETFAVLCLNLDHFKQVNDTLGHSMGDAVLRAVTKRLLQHCRETDTVSRFGGDEFAIIQTSLDQPHNATTLSKRLIETLSQPYTIDGHCITIGASIGIAMVPTDGNDADTLLKRADMALYRARLEGRGGYCFFEPAMDARMQARRALEIDLRQALVADQLEVFYQPIVDMRTRVLSGFEALIRWCHPVRGVVSPDAFIPLAEEIGLIVPIGDWVMLQACTDAATWPDHLKVSVNLSSIQFGGRGPVPPLITALKVSGLDPTRLEFEITETVMLDDTEATLTTLNALKALGVSIAMDDFGTGYSSLSYLRKFPFDRVKIDKSLIADIGDSDESQAIVDAVTSLCKTLGMATTVEGVETEAQMQALQNGHGTNVQGYLFGKPRPASAVAELCRSLGATLAGA